MKELTKKVIFVGGKGRIRKSTSAAAIAGKTAQQGSKTLLISTDPTHNLGDIFSQKIGGKITAVTEHLSALEIDPETETTNYIKGVKENIKDMVQTNMMEEVDRQLDTAKDSPGADEAALFYKLISVILVYRMHFDILFFN